MMKLWKHIFVFFILTVLFYFFIQSLFSFCKIGYRRYRFSYIGKTIIGSIDLENIEKGSRELFSNYLSYSLSSVEFVLEFENKPESKDLENMTFLLTNNFSYYDWRGPYLREQTYIAKTYLDFLALIFSLMFGLGAFLAYYLERKFYEY
ncbi:MAG: hypothetical protein ACP5Q5_10950 [Brevinematia bacterium]